MSPVPVDSQSCWQPLAVALVTSSSRGNRLLFYHQGSPPDHCARVKDVLSELETTLSEILAPSQQLVGEKFELTIDEWKFVGHPFSLAAIVFNVVFVLQSSSSSQVVHSYDCLSHLLGSAIVHEEQKCKFLTSQAAQILHILEDSDSSSSELFASKIFKECSVAKTLHSVLVSLQQGNLHVKTEVNGCSEVNVQLFCEAAPMLSEPSEGDVPCLVRSYSALLLFESCEAVISGLPCSCNPALCRLIKALSPLKSLKVVSLDADIPLSQTLLFASHLVHWKKAVAIYPLSESNIYITSPSADVRLSSDVSTQFERCFPGVVLAEMLSNFSVPVLLGDLQTTTDNIIPIVVWLLQKNQIIQLHTYVYIVQTSSSTTSSAAASGNYPPSSSSPTSSGFDSDCTWSHATVGYGRTCSADSGHSDEDGEDSLHAQLLQHLSPGERKSVMCTSAAGMEDDLALFARLSCYFHGSHHLEEIMLLENMPRSQLLTLIDKFSEVLVICSLPEHSVYH